MRYPLKLIEWHDAYSGNHSWFDVDELDPVDVPLTAYSLGFEIRRSEHTVTLAQSCNTNGRLCSLITIPLKMIVREQTFRSRLT